MTIQLTSILNSEARLAELHLMLNQRARLPDRAADPDFHTDLEAQLLTALDDPYLPIRHLAADALSLDLSAPLAQIIAEFATDTRTPTRARAAACLALKSSPDPQIATLLLQLARAPEADLRYHALVALNESPAVQDADLTTLVAERLHDTDPEIAIIAAQIAAARDWQQLIPDITQARQNIPRSIRLALSLALAELLANARDQPLHTPDDLIPELIKALKDERTLAAAAHALAYLNATQATDALIKTLDRRMTHPILRVGVAAALVELGHERGRQALASTLQSRRKDARGYAIRQVARLGLTEHIPHIIQLAHSNDYHADTALLALKDFNTPETLDHIHQIARQHPDPEQRELAHELTHHLTT